ncbi:MAG: OsmC family protein [Steroidobacteraceae bacterium]
MKASVLWMKDGQFIGKSDSGHTLIIDGPPDHGGKNLGARPMEMILMGLGGCTSIDVIDILKKSRQDVTDCVTQLTAERASTIPAVFTSVHIHFLVTGRNLKSKQVERAIELSATKYCSATLMLQRGGVAITHDFEIIEAAQ